MPSSVLMRSSGTSTVSDGPSRVLKMSDTRSLVAQLAPKSAVAICLTKMPSCVGYDSSTPSWRRMFSICSGLEILPARRYAGSPPTQLKRKKTSSTTPASVGTNCHSRRSVYGIKGRRSRASEVDVHPLGVEHRVLGVPDDARLLQRVADARVRQQPCGVELHDARHLVVQAVALRAIGPAARAFVAAVELFRLVAGVVALVRVRAVEELHEVVAVRVVRDPGAVVDHHAAFLLQLDQLREAFLLDLEAHADRLERALHQLVALAGGPRRGRAAAVPAAGDSRRGRCCSRNARGARWRRADRRVSRSDSVDRVLPRRRGWGNARAP